MKQEEKKTKTYTLATLVILVVIAAAAAFYGGMQYQKKQTANVTGDFRGQFGQNGRFGQAGSGNGNGQRRGMMGGGGARPVMGEIIQADDKSVTVKLSDGSSKIVILSDQTAINKASEGSKADLTTGERIAAFGTENSDGSITAQSIQLNPTFRGMMGTPQPTR